MQFPVLVDEGVELRPFALTDAQTFIDLITKNRHRLDRWMRWTAPVQTLDDASQLLQRFLDRLENDGGFHVGLWVEGHLAGGVACFPIDRQNRSTEIGYWLDEDYVGKGLVTRACRVVIDDLFTREDVHRIEIQAVSDNISSRAVAERLGFTFEGNSRESVWITDAFKDHAIYSLLDYEWQRQGESG